ncbi:hypothetical protein PsorP6_016452 [Peronosclerospora sorghi]|uniref:Uncharacterized protein n=1 Tax=Peronosclerospora sorghi TaxID=230839 RepID=A0ACC0VP92_9STRA|nr:hypothetical protein PsorP6_016452 [Peronosclerospora sorghi]
MANRPTSRASNPSIRLPTSPLARFVAPSHGTRAESAASEAPLARGRSGTSSSGTTRRYKKKRVESDPVSKTAARAPLAIETNTLAATPLPPGAVFYPTIEQFADPLKYIASIEPAAARTGICKIVPPRGWNPTFALNLQDDRKQFATRRQNIHQLQEGRAYETGKTHTFKSFRAAANAFRTRWFRARGVDPDAMTSEALEQAYWRIVETRAPKVKVRTGHGTSVRTYSGRDAHGVVVWHGMVEYANDLDTAHVGSGFLRSVKRFVSLPSKEKDTVDFSNPEYYRHSGWNLNNLPDAHGSLLRHLGTAINGVNVPWLYCGMLFASFCWHAEDNYMSSINYHHVGAKKRWYGIPSSDAAKFEAVMRTQLPERFQQAPDLHLHLTTMIPPSVLRAERVRVYTLVQAPGEIMLTFPKAYHCGFSEGFNCNEAVNFVLPTWLPFGRECVEMYRTYGRVSILSHDRFVFHAGSMQNLDEYAVRDCDTLLTELRRLYHEERAYTKALRAHGLAHVEELSGHALLDARAMDVDDARQCCHCNHTLFFSGVTCRCNPRRLACLRHTNELCRCAPACRCNPRRLACLRHTNELCRCAPACRTLLQWVSPADLRYAIRRVQTKMRVLRAQAKDEDERARVVAARDARTTRQDATHGAATVRSGLAPWTDTSAWIPPRNDACVRV